MATDFLLEIKEIPGESEDKKHPGLIEVTSFSWSASQQASFGRGGGGGSAKADLSDITFTAETSKASGKLFHFCTKGTHIPKATLFVRKAGGEQEDYYIIILEDVIVSSYSSNGSTGSGGRPSESFNLSFAKMEFEYKLQDKAGKVTTAAKHSYDQKTNTAV